MASLANSGQVCNALSRILVPAAREDEFVDALAAAMESMTVGDPADPNTQIGPLVAKRQQERVRGYIESGKSEGARLVTGGSHMPDGLDTGWYVRPTLFSDASNDIRIAREEIFGPVLTVISYRDEDEAIRIANDSEYGLAGSVFTSDVDRGYSVAARVRSGTFGVNEGYIMDPAAPFGGVKNSGYGRELGTEGIDSYTVSQDFRCGAGNQCYRLPPTSAGSGGGNGVVGVGVVDGGGAAGAEVAGDAAGVFGPWKYTIGSWWITWLPSLTTRELDVTV